MRARIHNHELTFADAIQNLHVLIIGITDLKFTTFGFASGGDKRKVVARVGNPTAKTLSDTGFL